MSKAPTHLRLPALLVKQGTSKLYQFSIDGKLLHDIATVSRVHRKEAIISGYQRPEVLNHVAAIRTYLESERPILPNSIVIAFDRGVKFEPLHGQDSIGHLIIPHDPDLPDEDKPGWIVDGQQRAAALRGATVTGFPVCVVGFVADVEQQRQQFILVNNTKPLPQGLINELLPGTTAVLPERLQRRRLPAILCARLNYDGDSPFMGLIQTPTNPRMKINNRGPYVRGIAKDNSIMKMIEHSLTDGVLYDLRGRENETQKMTLLLKNYWWAVANTFRDAWGKDPRVSRLFHGMGIVSMGFVMDWIAGRFEPGHMITRDEFAVYLRKLEPYCHWTEGEWDFGVHGKREWRAIQNTSQDVMLVTNYLVRTCRSLFGGRERLAHRKDGERVTV